ncbi:MAG: hypothetical protein QOI85_278 [Chloroflexota bacterium]|jgi:SAM-dependent methyltransferase|nr:hypothetical protein [Chloroflexota bacterium]
MKIAPPEVRARAFDAWADEYERYRPGYPAALFELIAERLALPPGAALVDLGAGTGKVARAGAARGWRVTAVDPGAARDSFIEMMTMNGVDPDDRLDIPYVVDCWIARRSAA